MCIKTKKTMKKAQRWYLIWGALAIGVLPLKAEVQGNSFTSEKILSSALIPSKSDEVQNLTATTQQQRKVVGTVKDDKGLGIPGVNIKIKGTNYNTVSDMDGNFSINVDKNAVLVFSYVGFNGQEVTVGSKSKLDITLKEDSKTLNEIVVIGYGKMKKGDLSAAVSTVSNVSKLQERPVSNAAEMLQGQIPGVSVVANGGHTGSTPTITIRGMGSRSGESPLYVVDGVPGAPFNFSDVTSITVLKDAASAAIYGAYAGSAGVILVTTKQATSGKPSFEYSVVSGLSTSQNLPQSLTIDEERKVRAAALGGEQYLPDGWNATKNPYIGTTRTDWINAIFRTGSYQRHNFAVSGGTEDFSNRLSLEYNDKQGTLINTYNKEITARFNSMFKLNKYIRLREDLSWQKTKPRDVNTSSAESGVILSALEMPRNAEVYTADGGFGGTAPQDAAYITKYGSNFSDIHGDVINPVRTLKANFIDYNLSKVTSSTFLDIMEPVRGLNFTSRFTYKSTNYFEKDFSPRRLEPGKPLNKNTLYYGSSNSYDWNFENTLTYDRVINRHNIGLMASTTTSEYKYRFFSAAANNFESEDEALTYFGNASVYLNPSDSYAFDRNLSLVGRASYSWADRYFVTGSMRRDYAGRLPQGQKYGDFPSATAAWKISSEPFMPKTDILNLLKLRASWGRIGNVGSIAYGYGYPTYSNYVFGSGDVGQQAGKNAPVVTGKYKANGYNAKLTWETSEQLDLGIDLAMFDNRLNIVADYFDKKTMGLIRQQDAGWTSSIGLGAMYVNDGEIHNSGFEFAATWKDKIGNVDYWLSGNFATLKNVVYNIGAADANGNKPVWTDGGTFKELNPYRTEEGQPLYSFYLVKNEGVFKTQAEIDNYKNANGTLIQPKAQVGDLKFVDKNENGSIDSGDKEFMGNAMPKFTYAFSAGFNWKKLSFSMMLQGVANTKIFNAYKFLTLNESVSNFNRSREILKALNGPNNDVPRISASDPNGNFTTLSDYYLENGSYLRVKNITVGYSLTDLIRKWNYLSSRNSTLDLTFSVDNLATITSYSGIDPEVGGVGLDGGQYPIARTFSVGLKLKF